MAKWYEQAVFYHMYPLGMLGAPKENHQQEVEHRLPKLLPWVDHIQKLGCTAVYIGPLFESTSHGYDTRDYKQVDWRLGDNEDFKTFVRYCHERGIRVVVDGVFNHTGREFGAFLDIQKNREQSPYCGWYQELSFQGNTPYNDGFWYKAWRNCFELANLNLQNPDVKNYLFDVIRFWIHEFDIDGIRLDCADCLDFGFMNEMRRITEQEKEDFWLMGEVIHGDYSRWIRDAHLHSVTNYELHKGLYSGHNDHNYFEIAHSIRRQFDSNGGIYRGCKLYSFLDNHDVDRIASKLQNPEHLPLVWMLLYTLPGIPSIYYGSEWGIEGRKEGGNDDPLRPALDLETLQMDSNRQKLIELISKLGQLKKDCLCLTDGSYRELYLRNRQYAYAMVLQDKAVVVALNCDDAPSTFEFPNPVGKNYYKDLFAGCENMAECDRISVALDKNSGKILLLE
jgi:glycosidase